MQRLHHAGQQASCRGATVLLPHHLPRLASRTGVRAAASFGAVGVPEPTPHGSGSAPFALPLRLMPADCIAQERLQPGAAGPLTVYSLRLTTAATGNASLSQPHASAVNIVLVGFDGRCILHRIGPLNDPAASREHVRSICEVVDASVGVNCSLVPPPSAAQQPPASSTSGSLTPSTVQPKLRFQRGQVDEVSFLAPELGPLQGVLVGTEAGSWMLEEMNVVSSRTAHTDRFVCRTKLGAKAGQGAVWMTPVPAGAFVYSSGDNTVVLTKEHADSTLRAMTAAQPHAQKPQVLLATLLLTASGSSVVGMAAGLDAAVPFALGGAAGMAYGWLDVGALLRRAKGAAAGATREASKLRGSEAPKVRAMGGGILGAAVMSQLLVQRQQQQQQRRMVQGWPLPPAAAASQGGKRSVRGPAPSTRGGAGGRDEAAAGRGSSGGAAAAWGAASSRRSGAATDVLGTTTGASSPRPSSRSPVVGLSMLVAAAALALAHGGGAPLDGPAVPLEVVEMHGDLLAASCDSMDCNATQAVVDGLSKLTLGVLGFAMYKLATLSVGLLSAIPGEPSLSSGARASTKQYEKY